ncbi:hypothetical protein LZ554_006336 [Drepanopeziza brunnea f. sp. 'monogermtubi']|nr:hypothetical protein LZ554_006336 [Drepanopeziza brunnea f. sp. 'monogermtubi']
MVQQLPGGNPHPGSYYQARDWQRTDNRDPYLEDPRLQHVPPPVQQGHQHAEATTIEAALKQCARIPVRNFALIVMKDNGEEVTYAGKSMTPYLDRIFSRETKRAFRAALRESEGRSYHPPYLSMGSLSEYDEGGPNRKYSSGGSSSELGRRPHRKSRSEESDDGPRISKRPRRGNPGQLRERSDEDAPLPVPIQERQQLVIGNEGDVLQYYHRRFREMQQSACKVMGKAFVRLIEPKKQTHHPYTKGNDKAPPWWPSTSGQEGVRHREPDHLLKHERTHLLVHILRMVIEPKKTQHATLQKSGGLDVKTLELATMEAMSNWFADKDHPDNEAKRPLLKEIFKVAKQEERYRMGEIDGSTTIPVCCDGKLRDDDDSDDNAHFKPEDDDEDDFQSGSIMTPPESLVSPGMGQNPHFQQHVNMDSEYRAQQQVVRSNLQLRPSYPAYEMPGMSYEDPVHAMSYHQPGPNQIDPSRRLGFSPVFPQQHHPLQHWGSNNMVNPSQPSPSYTTSPQAMVSAFSGPVLPAPQPQASNSPPNQFDSFQTKYDIRPAPGSQFRTGSIGHPHHPLQAPQAAPGGYHEYLAQEQGYSGPQELKEEPHQGMGQGGIYHAQA